MSSTEANQVHRLRRRKQALICATAAVLLALPFVTHAEQTACPTPKGNPLQNVRLFAGPTTEKAELVPDNEGGATWDVRGYKSPNQPHLILLCEYKDGQSVEVAVDRSAERCYVKGRKRITAWCGK